VGALGKNAFHASFVFNRLGVKSLQAIDCQRLIVIHVSRKELVPVLLGRKCIAAGSYVVENP
jgi:hypothetical protein